MLNKIYRAIVISRTKTAAISTLAHLSERDLNDMGISRASFVEAQVESVIAELDAQDREAANTKMRKQIEASAKRLFAAVNVKFGFFGSVGQPSTPMVLSYPRASTLCMSPLW
jgi:uncharacterized protein YjiS (DUF1127 family)